MRSSPVAATCQVGPVCPRSRRGCRSAAGPASLRSWRARIGRARRPIRGRRGVVRRPGPAATWRGPTGWSGGNMAWSSGDVARSGVLVRGRHGVVRVRGPASVCGDMAWSGGRVRGRRGVVRRRFRQRHGVVRRAGPGATWRGPASESGDDTRVSGCHGSTRSVADRWRRPRWSVLRLLSQDLQPAHGHHLPRPVLPRDPRPVLPRMCGLTWNLSAAMALSDRSRESLLPSFLYSCAVRPVAARLPASAPAGPRPEVWAVRRSRSGPPWRRSRCTRLHRRRDSQLRAHPRVRHPARSRQVQHAGERLLA
jgi:hypothetical protein